MPSNSTSLWLLAPHLAQDVLRDLQLARKDAKAFSLDSAGGAGAYGVQGGVAVIEASGAMTPRQGWYGLGYDAVLKAFRAAEADPAVSAILLDMDSPGGTVAGCQEVAEAIAACAKPCAAYTGSLMASAAYWLGSATGRVYATETAELGSIGVVMTHTDASKMLEEAGLAITVIASGEFKAAGNPFGALSEQDRAYFQAQCDGICAVFKSAVAQAMGLNVEAASEWAEGRVFLGAEAVKLGLASAVVSGRDEAVKLLQEASVVDRQTLSAQHPERVQELLAEGRSSAMAPADVLACVGSMLSADDRARAEEFFKACDGLESAKVKALAAVAFPAKAEAPAQEVVQAQAQAETDAESRAEILAGIQAASPHGVAPDASATAKTPGQYLSEAMDRIAKEGD